MPTCFLLLCDGKDNILVTSAVSQLGMNVNTSKSIRFCSRLDIIVEMAVNFTSAS